MRQRGLGLTFWNRKPDEPDHWHKKPETPKEKSNDSIWCLNCNRLMVEHDDIHICIKCEARVMEKDYDE